MNEKRARRVSRAREEECVTRASSHECLPFRVRLALSYASSKACGRRLTIQTIQRYEGFKTKGEGEAFNIIIIIIIIFLLSRITFYNPTRNRTL